MEQASNSRPAESSRRRFRIAMVLIAAGVVFAVGGGVALVSIFLGNPGDPADVVITAAMPIEVGDRLVMRVDEATCTVEILSVLEDGRLLLVPCRSDGVPAPTPRSSLRAPRFRRDAPEPRPGAGDVVLLPEGGAYARATVVEVRGPSVCVRPTTQPAAACAERPRAGLPLVRPAR